MDCTLKRLGNFFNYHVDENYQTLIICVLLSTESLDTFRFEFQQYGELKQRFLRPIHTRDFAPGACSRGTLREQSSSVCTNDFMGILHPREQNFHPAKCSTILNRLNVWGQAPGAN